MSADELRTRVVKTLSDELGARVKNLRRCKPRPPTVMQDGTQVAAAGVEEIALYAVDTNAWIDALTMAINLIDEEFRKMNEPVKPKDEAEPVVEVKQVY